jgi:hypothetical protein
VVVLIHGVLQSTQLTIQESNMKVLRILSDVRLVIAELEVHLGEDVRNSPTLCAIVPGIAGEPDQVVPLSTPDGRPIFMKMDNAIAP